MPNRCSVPRNFYPRPPRGGRHFGFVRSSATSSISIHALREEGDPVSAVFCGNLLFLSTPSARRATQRFLDIGRRGFHFYPRPPRGGRLPAGAILAALRLISIHALREEGDLKPYHLVHVHLNFYPRPPRGGRQQKQRENPPLLSHYIPLCTNCKEVPVKQTAKSHRYLCKRLVFRCEASGKTMCAACSHWRGIKRSVHYPAQTPGAAQHARP